MTDVFISYAREDKDFVQHLHDALRTNGREDWVDWKDIPPTAEWMQEIRSAIEASDSFVFIVSPDSISSNVCKHEIDHAVKNNKRLIPIIRREVSESRIPEDITKLNWIFFRDSDNFDVSFQLLVEAIDTDLDWVRLHTRLLVRAREWKNKEQEAISKCSIGLKIKAGRGGQPQTYIEYFEDWTLRPNADIEFEGTF